MRLKSVLIRLSKEKWGCFYLVFHTLMTLSLRHGYTGFLYIYLRALVEYLSACAAKLYSIAPMKERSFFLFLYS